MERVYRKRMHPAGGWTFMALVSFLTISFVVGASGLSTLDAMFLLAGAAAVDVLVFRLYVRPKLIVSGAAMAVLNPVRTYLVPWSDVASIAAEDILLIRTNGGDTIRVWAVQAPNIALALRRASGPERVASELNERLAEFRLKRGEHVPAPPRTPRTKLQLFALAFLVIVAGVLVLRFVVFTR